MRKNKEESVRTAMSWLALDRDVAEKSYDMAFDSFSEDGSPTLKGLQNSVALEKQRAGIKEEIPPVVLTCSVRGDKSQSTKDSVREVLYVYSESVNKV